MDEFPIQGDFAGPPPARGTCLRIGNEIPQVTPWSAPVWCFKMSRLCRVLKLGASTNVRRVLHTLLPFYYNGDERSNRYTVNEQNGCCII